MQKNIEKRVTQVVRDVLDIDAGADILDASIATDLAPTSLDQMTLFIALEDEFQESIPQDEVTHIDTIREIIVYIKQKLATD